MSSLALVTAVTAATASLILGQRVTEVLRPYTCRVGAPAGVEPTTYRLGGGRSIH